MNSDNELHRFSDNELHSLSSKINSSFSLKLQRFISVTCDLEPCWRKTSLTGVLVIPVSDFTEFTLYHLFHPYFHSIAKASGVFRNWTRGWTYKRRMRTGSPPARSRGRAPVGTAASIWFEIWRVVDPGQKNFDFSGKFSRNFDFS